MSGEWECPYCCNPAIVQQELTERRPNLSAALIGLLEIKSLRRGRRGNKAPRRHCGSGSARIRMHENALQVAAACTPGGSRLSGWLRGVPRGGLPMTVGRGAANQGTELPASQARLSRGRFGASSDPFRCFGVTVPSQIIGPLGIKAAGCQGHSFLPVLPWQPSLL